jgi:hypothetical protein
MTQHEKASVQEVPSLEPWLIVAFVGFVPLMAAFMLPGTLVAHLLALGGAMIVTSGVMLVRQERRKQRARR